MFYNSALSYFPGVEANMRKETKKQFALGARAALPVVLSFVPVGIAYGLMSIQAGYTPGETVFMSLAVYAGASQMMSTGMYAQGAGIAAIILATFVLNLRHLIMSTCVINRMKDAPLGQKLLCSFGITDETFAIFTTEDEEKATVPFFVGLALVSYLSWAGGSAIGAFASDFLPEILTASFGVAMYAMFVGIIMPDLRGRGSLALLVVITAAVNCVLSRFMEPSWATVCSTIMGAFAGVFFVELEGEGKKNES